MQNGRQLLFLLALVAFCLSVSANTFTPKRLHLIDYNTTLSRFLFRGNLPKNDQGQFVIKELTDTMKQKLSEETQGKLSLPDSFLLVDVSLLNKLVEGKDLAIEEQFFKQNPSVGHLVNWPIFGNVINGTATPAAIRKEMAIGFKHWDEDHLQDRVYKLHDMIHVANAVESGTTMPVVVYIHCEAGVDRTGELSGSYYMQWLGWSYKQSLQFDYLVSPRPIASFSEKSLNWYCWYLFYTRGTPKDCSEWLPKSNESVKFIEFNN